MILALGISLLLLFIPPIHRGAHHLSSRYFSGLPMDVLDTLLLVRGGYAGFHVARAESVGWSDPAWLSVSTAWQPTRSKRSAASQTTRSWREVTSASVSHACNLQHTYRIPCNTCYMYVACMLHVCWLRSVHAAYIWHVCNIHIACMQDMCCIITCDIHIAYMTATYVQHACSI